MATASDDKTLLIWQRRETDPPCEPVLELASPSGAVKWIRFSRDGRRLIANVLGETALRVWRLDRLRERLRDLQLDW